MTAVLMHARAEVRRRWRSLLALSLLVALAGGAVVALAAGARRANSAYPRLLRAERAADALVFVDPPRAAQVQQLPEVADSASMFVFPVVESDVVGAILDDAGAGHQLDHFKFLAGRPLNPERADEAVVGFLVAQSRHLHVGSTLAIHVLPARQAIALRVVGIEAGPGEFPPRTSSNLLPVYLSPAFLHTPIGAQSASGEGSIQEVAVRLRRGALDLGGFRADLYRLTGSPAGFGSLADQSANVRRSMHLQVVTLWLMAAFAALAIAIVALQLLSRQGFEEATDHAALLALGMTPSQLLVSGMVRDLAMAAAGAVGAGIAAWLLSPLLPLGTARLAEPHPGLAFDAAAIGWGTTALLLIVTALGGVALFRAMQRTGPGAEDTQQDRPSSVGNTLAAAPVPLVVTIGAGLALQPGRGRSAIPVRAGLAAAAIGVAAVAAAMTFASSLGHLLATPALYGVTYDADVRSNGNDATIAPVLPALLADSAVAGLAAGSNDIPMQANGVSFGALAAATLKGSLSPTVIEGRLPQTPGEILLGSRTMQDLHAHVGQTILVSLQNLTTPLPLRIVGRGVLATVSDTEELGRGAAITPECLTAFAPLAPPGFQAPPPGGAVVRFRRGLSVSTEIAALQNRLGDAYNVTVSSPAQPADVVNFGQVRDLPQVLSGLLALMAAATIAYLLVTSIRRRRRYLAVLKTLGFVPRQVSAAIAWQATTLVLVAALIGLPLGLAAGRSAWALVAGQIGVVVRPVVPWSLVLGLLPVALLIANLVAAGPALAAGRIPPAIVLRSE